MHAILLKREWMWKGPVPKKEERKIIKTTIHWTLEKKTRRGRNNTTWRYSVQTEMKP